MKDANKPPSRRVIVDFKKLTPEMLSLVVAKFPDGYDSQDVIRFCNTNKEWVEAVEIITEDTKYLVKIGARLEKVMEDYDEDDYLVSDKDDSSVIKDPFDQFNE